MSNTGLVINEKQHNLGSKFGCTHPPHQWNAMYLGMLTRINTVCFLTSSLSGIKKQKLVIVDFLKLIISTVIAVDVFYLLERCAAYKNHLWDFSGLSRHTSVLGFPATPLIAITVILIRHCLAPNNLSDSCSIITTLTIYCWTRATANLTHHLL